MAPTRVDSSMKMMQGAFLLGLFEHILTRERHATNISTKSEPEIVKNGTWPRQLPRARISVLPGRGGRPAARRAESVRRALILAGVAQKLDDLLQILLGFIDAGDISNVPGHAPRSASWRATCPKPIALPAPPCICRDRRSIPRSAR